MAEQPNIFGEFIDAESDYREEKSSYEEIVVRQINHCVGVLSKEVIGGSVRVRMGKGGQQETYIEDVRELIINSVSTLRMLLMPFIKDGDMVEDLNKIVKDTNEYYEKIGERDVIVSGRGQIKVKELGIINKDNPAYKEFMEFKTIQYRKTFEVLVMAYNKYKLEIAKLESE